MTLNVATNTCGHCNISVIFDLGNLIMALDNNMYQTPTAGSAIGAKGIIQCFVFMVYSQINNHLKPQWVIWQNGKEHKPSLYMLDSSYIANQCG